MAIKTLEENINQAVNDFNAIKSKIVESGIDMPKGTPTSAYPNKIEAVYQKGADNTAENISPLIVEQSNRLAQCFDDDFPDGDKLYNEIYNEGVKNGKEIEYDAFWASIPANVSPANLFSGRAWNNITFKPNKNFKLIGNAANMFYNNGYEGDLEELCRNQNIDSFDFSKCTTLNSLFAYSDFTRLGVIDLTSAIDKRAESLFLYMYNIKTIDKLIVHSRISSLYNCFKGLSTLERIIFEGEVTVDFDIFWSHLLTRESIISIINTLSTTTTNLTVKISLIAVNTAFETAEGLADGSTSEEWQNLIATKSNWTISLIDS